LAGLEPAERERLERRRRRYGPLAVVLTRPVPLVAEAAALLAGGTGMPLRTFLGAAAGGNLAVAAAWTLAGVLGREADSLQWVLVASLAVPVAIAWLSTRRGLQSPPRQL
jgi:3-dehydroquinate synthase